MWVQCTKCSETSDDGRLRVVDIVLVVKLWTVRGVNPGHNYFCENLDTVLMKHMLCWAHNCSRVILLFEFVGLLQSNGTEMSTKNTEILAMDRYNLTFRLQLHSYKVVWVKMFNNDKIHSVPKCISHTLLKINVNI